MPITVSISMNPADVAQLVTSSSGEIQRAVTASDLAAFGLSDDAVRIALGQIEGRAPDDVFYGDPTRWGDLYAKFGWPPVQLTIVPLSVVAAPSTTSTAGNLVYGDLQTGPSETAEVDVAAVGGAINDVGVDWSESSWSASDTIEHVFSLTEASPSFSLAATWQQTTGTTQGVSFGLASGIDYLMAGGSQYRTCVRATTGTTSVTITYQATLAGYVGMNYSHEYQGHHFYARDVNEVLQQMGAATAPTVVETVSVTYVCQGVVVPQIWASDGSFQAPVVWMDGQIAPPGQLPLGPGQPNPACQIELNLTTAVPGTLGGVSGGAWSRLPPNSVGPSSPAVGVVDIGGSDPFIGVPQVQYTLFDGGYSDTAITIWFSNPGNPALPTAAQLTGSQASGYAVAVTHAVQTSSSGDPIYVETYEVTKAT